MQRQPRNWNLKIVSKKLQFPTQLVTCSHSVYDVISGLRHLSWETPDFISLQIWLPNRTVPTSIQLTISSIVYWRSTFIIPALVWPHGHWPGHQTVAHTSAVMICEQGRRTFWTSAVAWTSLLIVCHWLAVVGAYVGHFLLSVLYFKCM
jgi:hypothetical protein